MSKFKSFLLLALSLLVSVSLWARGGSRESLSPTADAEVERLVDRAEVNSQVFVDVMVKIESSSSGKGVKVKISSRESGKTLYKKNFPKSYLYGYADGTIEVGITNVLTNMVIKKSSGGLFGGDDVWKMTLREKGIY